MPRNSTFKLTDYGLYLMVYHSITQVDEKIIFAWLFASISILDAVLSGIQTIRKRVTIRL